LALDGEEEAREDRLAVDQHRARPAFAELAAVLGAGQLEILAQHLEERFVNMREDLTFLAVHREGQQGLHPLTPLSWTPSGNYRWTKLTLRNTKPVARVSSANLESSPSLKEVWHQPRTCRDRL